MTYSHPCQSQVRQIVILPATANLVKLAGNLSQKTKKTMRLTSEWDPVNQHCKVGVNHQTIENMDVTSANLL